MPEVSDLNDIKKSLEVIFTRLDELESRANDLERNNGAISNLLKKIEAGFSDWKHKQEQAKNISDNKLSDIEDKLKINTEGDKAQTSQIASLENEFTKVNRQIENITIRLNGGYDETWPLEQMRSTIMNSALTAAVFRWLFGAVGVSGVGAILVAVFGIGQVDEQEFTYLSTHLELQNRVEKIELDIARETAKWDVVYDNLNIEIEPAP